MKNRLIKQENRRQDYILRVRYHNPLPPPPFPPKLINIPNPVKQYALPNFVSTLVQEKKIPIENDIELGMPLDLAGITGFFEGDTSWMHSDLSSVNLDPIDRSLLKVAGGSGSTHLEVPFLRRTEYISSEVARAASNRGNLRLTASTSKALAEQRGRSLREVPKQLEAINESFDVVQQPLEQLKHPTKPDLKPVSAWNLLPNTSMAGIQHLMLRVADDLSERSHSYSSLVNLQEGHNLTKRHEVALFMPSSAEGEEFLSYYLPSEETAEEIQAKVNDASADVHEPFVYNHFRNFDASMHVNSTGLEDLCLSFHTDKDHPEANQVLYTPIYARSTLKRRHVRAPVSLDAVDGIELSLRDLNDEESLQLKRARYDTFGLGNIKDLEEEEEKLRSVEGSLNEELSEEEKPAESREQLESAEQTNGVKPETQAQNMSASESQANSPAPPVEEGNTQPSPVEHLQNEED